MFPFGHSMNTTSNLDKSGDNLDKRNSDSDCTTPGTRSIKPSKRNSTSTSAKSSNLGTLDTNFSTTTTNANLKNWVSIVRNNVLVDSVSNVMIGVVESTTGDNKLVDSVSNVMIGVVDSTNSNNKLVDNTTGDNKSVDNTTSNSTTSNNKLVDSTTSDIPTNIIATSTLDSIKMGGSNKLDEGGIKTEEDSNKIDKSNLKQLTCGGEAGGCELCRIHLQPRPGWQQLLKSEFEAEYFQRIVFQLHQTLFYPAPKHLLRALSFFECPETKVVILGQDPYHGPDQAVGLSFSVPTGRNLPPSLQNIRKEILASTGQASICPGGSLVNWAKQGVLLLNTTLSVAPHQPRSHAHFGWHHFTDRIITLLNQTPGLVFLLWGKDAQEKQLLINPQNHLILTSPHPSPFSARRGFFGNNHFQLTNDYLIKQNKQPIHW
ncbi:uracil-DNA glycosylase [Nematocida homosporus]|uniref:uracil-DNA glycosylase n=1 Tax=Nematocida homosporus TaxID=1912981 RepID=UPI00221F5553|nr:uracil-DNA glycosylase [Nematocida homosporus]KAI5185645.1 uracil-DNA glycosylase [Nematocida homosporus]